MERLSYPEFIAARAQFDVAVASTPWLRGTCSLSPWQIAAHDSLHGAAPVSMYGHFPAVPAGEREHLILRSEGAWLAMVESDRRGVFTPFEPVWMFASPLAGPGDAALELLWQALGQPDVRALLLGGVPRGSEVHRGFTSAPGRARRMGYAEGTESCVIDLTDGVEAWIGRRSKNLRRTLRRSHLPAGVEVVDGSCWPLEEAFERLVEIQAASYKAQGGEDIFAVAEFRDFYLKLFSDHHRSGELRLYFAIGGDEVLAYNVGFLRGSDYRGYQMGFIEEARPLGLGTLLQLTMLRRAEAEGAVRFDMGMPAPYKERWIDRTERSVILLAES